MLILDIETIAQPGLVAPEFEPAANIKDPAKIAANIQSKKDAWLADAALHADRGMVALVGVREDKTTNIFHSDNQDGMREDDCIEMFWDAIQNKTPIVTFDGNRFDLPFLVRRSIILGVKWPHDIFDRWGYLDNNRFIDLHQIWKCGDHQEHISLDRLAQIVLGKSKETSGADFGRLWMEDRPKAIEHLITDLELTEELAKRIMLI